MPKRIKAYLDHLYEMDYKERPVDIDSFLNDPQYLGKTTRNGIDVYPIWRRALKEIFVTDKKYIVALTGCIGGGKSRCAIYGALYTMHRVLCLKDPWAFMGKAAGGKMQIIFFNLTKSLGGSAGFNIMQTHLNNSDWFKKYGTINGSIDNPRVDFSIFEYCLGSPYSKGSGQQGLSPIIAILDEVDSPNESEGQKRRILQAYNDTERRLDSRFVFDGETIGRMFLVASKQEQLSFLSTFIEEKRNNSNVIVFDVPKWEAGNDIRYCGETFNVMIGDAYIQSKILRTQEDIEKAVKIGKEIIKVPIEYLQKFEDDIIGALRDIAGTSVTYSRRSKLFNSEKLVDDCMDDSIPSPLSMLQIDIGINDLDLTKFIDFSKIQVPRHIPRYIHQDISYSGDGDAMGIGMSCACGWKKVNIEQPDGTYTLRRSPVIRTELAIRIKAREGDKIPLYTIRKFILDLRDIYHFNIDLFTADLSLLSEDTKQILTKRGIKCEYLSLDKTPEGYKTFRGLVEECRWVCYNNPYLRFELVNLEEDPESGKIDHPNKVQMVEILKDGDTEKKVLKGSKDVSDGVVGSVISAVNHCGEPPDIEVMTKIMKKLTDQSSPPQNNPLWWVDLDKTPKNKRVEQFTDGGMSNKEINIMKDMLRRLTK